MATSSLSRDFVINDPKAVDKLIKAMENPVKINLPKRDLVEEQKQRKSITSNLSSYRFDEIKI